METVGIFNENKMENEYDMLFDMKMGQRASEGFPRRQMVVACVSRNLCCIFVLLVLAVLCRTSERGSKLLLGMLFLWNIILGVCV